METKFLSHSNACIKVNNCLNLKLNVLFNALSPRAMDYIKLRQGGFYSDRFLFCSDHELAMAWTGLKLMSLFITKTQESTVRIK